jgi:uncharacterized protein
MPSLARVNVAPIKGTALHNPDTVDLTPLGIPGNRRFYLVDERGSLFSGGDLGRLVQVLADHDRRADRLTLTFPDGTVVTGAADAVSEPVTTDFYGRPVPGAIVAGPFAEAFSAYVGTPLRLVRADREGDGPDEFRLTLVSFASVRDLGARAQHDGELDSRRFRVNLELEGCDPYEEDTWDGRRVRVGDAILRLHGKIPRCVVTTQSPQTGDKDFDTLKQIAAYRPMIDGRRGIPFGMYAEVEDAGTASIGDEVAPID